MIRKSMKLKTLALLVSLLAVVLGGTVFANSTLPELCRKSAQQVQCELAADAARNQCLADAGGDPDAIFICELDWRETQQLCDTIPPECDYNVP